MAALTVLFAGGLAHGQGTTRPTVSQSGERSEFAQLVHAQIEAQLLSIASGDEFVAARDQVFRLFQQVARRADASDKELWREAAYASRLVRLLDDAEPDERASLMQCFLDNESFGQALAFACRGNDDLHGVFELVNRFRRERADSLATHGNLAAAICLVHDKPLKRRINENAVESPDPLAIYDYFRSNEAGMRFGVRNIPVELLIYVVDVTSSIDELRWAHKQYRQQQNIGALFFTIEYDHDHLQGKPKKVTQAGFNLLNIARYGGVCADQAYFACSVGKALGVPTAYTVGASGEVSHAWVGFLQSDPRRAWWNFDSGRYEAYQGVRGVVTDPQSGRRVPDSSIALLAEFVTARELDRYATIGMTDGALWLISGIDEAGLVERPGAPIDHAVADAPKGEPSKVRSSSKEDALALLEAALRQCPGYAEGWFLLRRLASEGKLNLNDKKKWANVLHRLCGEQYPDFYLAVVGPMIETVDDVEEQNALWNAAFRTFQKRHDLAAEVRMQQAMMWRTHGEARKAGQCCEDIIERYANAGPFVLQALNMASELLIELKQPQRIVALHEKAWSLTKKPKDMAREFFTQSNWYRVGLRYAETLKEAGRSAEAEQVRSTIGVR